MADYWHNFWTALTLGGGYNSVVVMAGLAALGAAAGPIGALMILKRRPLLADAIAHAKFHIDPKIVEKVLTENLEGCRHIFGPKMGSKG